MITPDPVNLESARVLVVDDDDTVREVVHRYLARDGHTVLEAADGATALTAVRREAPDLVVLDLMLPGIDGLEICREIRRRTDIPVIMLTALGTESDRVVGLEYGADDYVVKPFSPRELALRVARVLQRTRQPVALGEQKSDLLRDGDLEIDETARTVHRDGEPLSLTGREFDLLSFLVRNPGQAFSRAELMDRVWQWSFGDQSTVTVHARRVREKIEKDPSHPTRLITVWGLGYRFETSPVEQP